MNDLGFPSSKAEMSVSDIFTWMQSLMAGRAAMTLGKNRWNSLFDHVTHHEVFSARLKRIEIVAVCNTFSRLRLHSGMGAFQRLGEQSPYRQNINVSLFRIIFYFAKLFIVILLRRFR